MAEIPSPIDLTSVVVLNLTVHSNLLLNFGRETLSHTPQLCIKRHEKTKPVTLLLDGLQGGDAGFDIVTALQHGLLQLIDATSNDIITIPPNDTQPKARTIRPREIDEVHNITFHPRHEFWKQLVRPGRRYLIKFSESSGLSWSQYGPKE